MLSHWPAALDPICSQLALWQDEAILSSLHSSLQIHTHCSHAGSACEDSASYEYYHRPKIISEAFGFGILNCTHMVNKFFSKRKLRSKHICAVRVPLVHHQSVTTVANMPPNRTRFPTPEGALRCLCMIPGRPIGTIFVGCTRSSGQKDRPEVVT